MAEISMRELVPHDQGERRIRVRGAQYAERNHDAIVGRERADVGIDLKLDGYSAGNHRNDHPHFIGSVTPGQNLNRSFAIVPHIAAQLAARSSKATLSRRLRWPR